MSFVNALGLVLCIIGGFLTYLSLGPLAHVFLIWAVFIATATGVAIGGTNEAFKNMVICGIAGVLLAWTASLIIINVPGAKAALTLPVWAAIVVGITTGCLAWVANISIFPAIPAVVVGYAMTFGYLLGDPAKLLDNKILLGATLENPLVCIIASIVIAAGFGIVALKLATMLSTKAAVAQPAE